MSTATLQVTIESMGNVDSAYLWTAYAPVGADSWLESSASGFEVTSAGEYELSFEGTQAGTEYEVRPELWNESRTESPDFGSMITFSTATDDESAEEPEGSDDEPVENPRTATKIAVRQSPNRSIPSTRPE